MSPVSRILIEHKSKRVTGLARDHESNCWSFGGEEQPRSWDQPRVAALILPGPFPRQHADEVFASTLLKDNSSSNRKRDFGVVPFVFLANHDRRKSKAVGGPRILIVSLLSRSNRIVRVSVRMMLVSCSGRRSDFFCTFRDRVPINPHFADRLATDVQIS